MAMGPMDEREAREFLNGTDPLPRPLGIFYGPSIYDNERIEELRRQEEKSDARLRELLTEEAYEKVQEQHQRMMDEILFGASYVTNHGRRIDPRDVRIPGSEASPPST